MPSHSFSRAPESLDQRLSGRTIRGILQLLRERLDDDAIQKVLADAEITGADLEGEGAWLPVTRVVRLCQNIVRHLAGQGDALPSVHPLWQLFRATGRSFLTREQFGPGWYAMRLWGAPSHFYRHLGTIAPRFTRMADYEVLETGRRHAVIAVRPRHSIEVPAFCQWRLGLFEAVPAIWGLPFAHVEHETCVHDEQSPADRCVYRVSYVERSQVWRHVLSSLGVGLASGAAVASLAGSPESTLASAALGGILSLAVTGWWRNHRDDRTRRLEADHHSALFAQLDRRYQALRESQLRFKQLSDHIHQVFWLSTPDRSRYLYVSPAFQKVWGRERQELDRDPGIWEAAIHPEDRERFHRYAHHVVRPDEIVVRVLRPSGDVRHVREQVFPVLDEKGQFVRLAGLSEDVTDRVRAEALLRSRDDELRQAQKMEAVGRLAGGIAHDFNNLLSVITSATDIALEELGDDHPVCAELNETLAAAGAAAGLTRKLLAYGRRQLLTKSVIQLDDMVSDALTVADRALPPGVTLDVELGADGQTVKADPRQVREVLANLLANAGRALARSGGRVTVETYPRLLDQVLHHAHGAVEPGDYLVLDVRDDGEGMPHDILEHVFEPFFSTKGDEEGAGLGLATVQGIVTQHDGFVTCESKPGQGTRLRVYLPRHDGG